jgi:F0F1-type ATP synthase membrane subunit b/b'
MLEVAKDSLQRLEGAETALRKESEAIFAGLENQLAYSTNESLAKAEEDLGKNTATITAKTNETLLKLHQNFEMAAQNNVESLLASLGSQMTRILQEKAAEVSREFSTGLEGYTRSYLESIGKSIAEIPRNLPGHSGRE